jgi:PAS domain S-box-containing protein
MVLMINLPPHPPAARIQILVVEDEKIIAMNLQESLEVLGYNVVAIAASGEQAIEKAAQLHPDLVLMDIRLKGTIDGIQATTEIWEQLQIPVIYVTGHSDQATLDRAKLTAPFGYVLKPVKEKELYISIETALHRYEREQFLNAVLQGMGDGVIVVDAQERVKYLNHVAETLTGWQNLEARNRQLTDISTILHEQTRQPIVNPTRLAIQQDRIIYLENHAILITPNGNEIPIADSAAPIKNNRGVITGAVLVFRDDTQRRLEAERNLSLERAHALSSQVSELQRLDQLKDDFLATVSHELRTPLSNISMAIHMLEIVLNRRGVLTSDSAPSDSAPSDAAAVDTSNAAAVDSQSINRYLKIMREQCDRELHLINDLLDMRAIDADAYPIEPTLIHIQHWLPQILEAFAERIHNQNQHLQIDIPADLPAYFIDRQSLTRILLELLNNACKYTPPHETIRVSVHIASLPQNQPLNPSFPFSHSLQITIANSGVEIPPEECIRIFNPFYRIPNGDPYKQGGTGLGLALVKKLVDRLQGTISVASSQNWTIFTLQFLV